MVIHVGSQYMNGLLNTKGRPCFLKNMHWNAFRSEVRNTNSELLTSDLQWNAELGLLSMTNAGKKKSYIINNNKHSDWQQNKYFVFCDKHNVKNYNALMMKTAYHTFNPTKLQSVNVTYTNIIIWLLIKYENSRFW